MNSETTWTFFSIILQLLDFILAQICLRLFYLLNWVFLKTKQTFAEISARNEKKIVKLTWFVFNSWKWNMTQKLQGRHGEFEPGKAQPFLDWLFLTRLFLTEILKLSVPNKVPVLSSKIFVKLSKLLATYFDLHQISPEWHYI